MYSLFVDGIKDLMLRAGGVDLGHSVSTLNTDKGLSVVKQATPRAYKKLKSFLKIFHLELTSIVYQYAFYNIRNDIQDKDTFFLQLYINNEFTDLIIPNVSKDKGDIYLSRVGGKCLTSLLKLEPQNFFSGLCPHYWWQVFALHKVIPSEDFYKHYKKIAPHVIAKLEEILKKYHYKIDVNSSIAVGYTASGYTVYPCINTEAGSRDKNIIILLGAGSFRYSSKCSDIQMFGKLSSTDFNALAKASMWNLIVVDIAKSKATELRALANELSSYFIILFEG